MYGNRAAAMFQLNQGFQYRLGSAMFVSNRRANIRSHIPGRGQPDTVYLKMWYARLLRIHDKLIAFTRNYSDIITFRAFITMLLGNHGNAI